MTHRAVNLANFLTQTARRLPDATALVHGQQRWSWRDLDDRVSALATTLRERGVRHGDCVMVHGTNHPEYVQALFAIWRVGAVIAPTNVRLTPADVAGIAATCRPVALLCGEQFRGHADAVSHEIDLPAGTLWLAATEGNPDSVAAQTTITEAGDAAVHVGDPAWYFFTSGTSGTPKAAVLTHEQMGFVITNHLCDLMPATTERDVSLVVAPLSHGAGIHLLPQVAVGAPSVLTSSAKLDGAEVWTLVERERVTNLFTVPTILKLLCEHPEVASRDHSSLRYVIYAGAPMYDADQRHARAVLGDVLVQYYGLGEVTGNITVLPSRLHDHPRPAGVEIGTCGIPRTGIQISIQDDTGREVPSGEQGEICVAGPAVCAGYLNNPEANAKTFRQGWFRTGDLGLLDQHGYLYVTGRASDMYISGGSNVYPRDIEEKLLAHPAISECAVLGMPDAVWGEVGVAVCVAGPGSTIDVGEVSDWLGSRIARYKMPRHILVWPEIPKSGYGKIVKRTIRSMLEEQAWPPVPADTSAS